MMLPKHPLEYYPRYVGSVNERQNYDLKFDIERLKLMVDKKTAFKWEIWGILFIVIIGSLLHFVFDWTGQWKPAALGAAVNESTWEHLKLAFWPALFYAFIEFRTLRKNSNFLLAKAVGIFLMPIIIIILFYSYTAIIEYNFIWDILIFIFAVTVGQIVSYRLIVCTKILIVTNVAAIIFLGLLLLAFSLLTYFAPHFMLFQDPVSGSYGVIPK